jgi:pyridoxine kinase
VGFENCIKRDENVLTWRCRTLSDIAITDLDSLAAAIQVLHKTYQVPHVIITSLRLTRDNHTVSSRAPSKPASTAGSGPPTPLETQGLNAATSHPSAWPASSSFEQSQPAAPQINLGDVENLTIIGSTATSDYRPRLFRIDTPQLPLFFSGTGDMFAALTIPRLIEAVQAVPELSSKPSWRSPDDVPADELPLAKACQKVLASMQAILGKTTEMCQEKMKAYDARVEKEGRGEGVEASEERAKNRHLALMNASEVKVVRFAKEIVDPPELEKFKPQRVEGAGHAPHEVTEKKPDGLNGPHVGVGVKREGAVQVETAKEGSEVASVEKALKESGLKDIEPDVPQSKEARAAKEDLEGDKL